MNPVRMKTIAAAVDDAFESNGVAHIGRTYPAGSVSHSYTEPTKSQPPHPSKPQRPDLLDPYVWFFLLIVAGIVIEACVWAC